MKIKITGRDVKFFFLGVLAMLLLDVVLDWDQNIKDFKDGLKGARYNETSK